MSTIESKMLNKDNITITNEEGESEKVTLDKSCNYEIIGLRISEEKQYLVISAFPSTSVLHNDFAVQCNGSILSVHDSQEKKTSIGMFQIINSMNNSSDNNDMLREESFISNIPHDKNIIIIACGEKDNSLNSFSDYAAF